MEFDFEGEMLKILEKENAKLEESQSVKPGGHQKEKIIVCTHWLKGLCQHGKRCTFLHRLDKNRMAACKHGKLCKIRNCPLRHVAEEEIAECIFYKQGFCYNGPKCVRRHIKRTPEECPADAAFEPVSFIPTYQTQSSEQQTKKVIVTHQPNENYRSTLCTHWLLSGNCHFGEKCHYAHGEEQLRDSVSTHADFLVDSDVTDHTRNKLDAALTIPFNSMSLSRTAYFLLQSPDLRSVKIAKRRLVWAVSSRIAQELNSSFRSSENVVIFFCVRALRGIYGVAKMASIIPDPASHKDGMPEFSIKWMRTMRVALKTVANLKLGMGGMFVGRSAIDGRFESKVGYDMLLTAYRKPEWDWPSNISGAEKGIRLAPLHGTTAGNEYYPAHGRPAYSLQDMTDDTLFAKDWIDRVNNISVSADGRQQRDKPSRGDNQPTIPIALPASFPDFYTGNLPGFIFCGITPAVEEMFLKFLVGLPAHMQEIAMMHTQPNVPLFIFDSQQQVLLGIFSAVSPVAFNMDPAAFTMWMGMGPSGGSPLPVQLRFRVVMEAPRIPAGDPELIATLGGPAMAMAALMGGPLDLLQTRGLANLLSRRAAAIGGGNRAPKNRT